MLSTLLTLHLAVVPEVLLFPEPMSMSLGPSHVSIARGSFHFNLQQESPLLERAFDRYLRLIFAWDRDGAEAPYTIDVSVQNTSDLMQLSTLNGNEGYTLQLNETGGVIEAPAVWGVLRALETLSQLAAYNTTSKIYTLRYVPCRIVDEPRLPWRGLMLDTSRRFYPLPFLLHTLDAMAQNKLNIFHWHITDAESCPLVSTRFPNLSSYGAFSESATYSPQDVAALIAYAKDRGIRVVMETDMPGHSWALGGAAPMTNCSDAYPHATEFWKDVMDVTAEALYEFLDGFIGEMAERLEEQVYHLGGDEVGPTCWNQSAKIRAFVAQKGWNSSEAYPKLYSYFEQRAHATVTRHGKTPMAWDDVFEHCPEALPSDAIVHHWRAPELLTEAMEKGYRVVTSKGLYLTAGDGIDTDFVTTWQTIYDIELPPRGMHRGGGASLPPPSPLFLGAEACQWGVDSWSFNADAIMWPRLAVLAEKLWSREDMFRENDTSCGRQDRCFGGTQLNSSYTSRLVMHGCSMLRRGVAGTPADNRDHFSRRSPWFQCEVNLPPQSMVLYP